MDQLPQRKPGAHLPRAAFQVANVDPDRRHLDEKTLRLIADALRHWQPDPVRR